MISFSRLFRCLLLAGATCLAPMRNIRAQAGSVDVHITGIRGELEDNVKAVLQLAREAHAGKLTPNRVERLHRRAEEDIATALQPFGYYHPVVTKSLERHGNNWDARYVIDPGPVVKVHSVAINVMGEGSNSADFQKLVSKFPLRRGDTLRHLRYQAGKLSFLTLAADSGYLKANFDTSVVRVDRKAETADIEMQFDTGPRATFGPVRFHQEREILDTSFLATRISVKQGEPFRHDKLLDLQTSLSEDPYFARVEVTPRPDSAVGHDVPIDVDLVPRDRHANEFGIGYGTDTGPRGHAQSIWRYLNRKGHNAEATLNLGAISQSITTTYRIPAFGTPTGILTFEAGYSRDHPKTSLSHTGKVRTSLLRKRLGWQETFSLGFQREKFTVGTDSGTSNLLIAGASWGRSASDNKAFPGRGYKAQFDIQGSEHGVLADLSFLQLHATAKGIVSYSTRSRLLGRVEVGHTFTNAFHALPATLRYFTGGDQTVRGFGFQALGELDSAGTVIGAPTVIVASIETDYRVFGRYGVAVFTDIGNAQRTFTLNGLEQGVGAGLRWQSPVGQVRLDGAFAVSRPGAPFRIHFSIGADL